MPTKPNKMKLEAETITYVITPQQLEAVLRENLDIPDHAVIRFNTGIDEITGGGGMTSVFKGVVIFVNAQPKPTSEAQASEQKLLKG